MPYTLNGSESSIIEEPRQIDGRTYLPFREVLEGLGGRVDWDNETKTARGTAGQWTATFQMGDTTADVNGQQVSFPAPAVVEDGRLYVPAEFFKSAYGYNLNVSGDRVEIWA